MTDIFDRRESEVRSYCRSFPVVFKRAKGEFLYDEAGREYTDFFAGAGTLNYGHNHPAIKQAVIDYLNADGVVHALDMWTDAKRHFLQTFEEAILQPRNLNYKVQFTGPTGTNAVEAALKLARKVKQRSNVICFTNGYHGLSAGALALTGNRHFRNEAFVNRLDASFVPFDGYIQGFDTIAYLRKILTDNSSGIDIPAAVILETIQAEGGVNVASAEWLRNLEALCREFDILLIVDDIQVGNGRTGKFFSFEDSGIRPDLVTISKSIGALGLPMSLVLINPEIDAWKPAEHTGTFRGNNLAFVAAKAALDHFWRGSHFESELLQKSKLLSGLLQDITAKYPERRLAVRGRGLIQGLQMPRPEQAKAVSREAFRQGIVIELAGPNDEVLKFLPPLVIQEKSLRDGVAKLAAIIDSVLASSA
jgi:diaminobutyrate-2-oxoglutarate transaminase